MADSNIQLNTDGTGKKLDTRTESTNSEHRQVFVIGDPATNTGVAPVDGTKGLAVDLTATGANTTAIKVDNSAVTQPVSAASLPLPTGAATAAKQPALGTAGTASADVITVQGVTSMTALKTDSSAVTQPVSAASLPLPTGAATSANQSTSNTSLASVDGKLVTAKTDDYDTGAGTDTIQSLGIALPASGGHVVGGTSTNPLKTDPTGTTTQPVSGTVTANAGTGNFGANLTQINGTAISSTNPLPTTQYTTTGNGFTSSHYISAATTNATNIKASAGDIGGIQAYNNTGTIGYLKLYDKASAPTVGTDVPVKTILIPANTAGAGTNISFASPGISCSSGIAFAITGGIGDADTTSVAANAFVVNFDTK